MKLDRKKRALSYLVLVLLAAGLMFLFRQTPMNVDVSFDLTSARFHAGLPLDAVCIEVREEGTWISTYEELYPPSRYEGGPPPSTRLVQLPLKKGGAYAIRAFLRYGAVHGVQGVYLEEKTFTPGPEDHLTLSLSPQGPPTGMWCRSRPDPKSD